MDCTKSAFQIILLPLRLRKTVTAVDDENSDADKDLQKLTSFTFGIKENKFIFIFCISKLTLTLKHPSYLYKKSDPSTWYKFLVEISFLRLELQLVYVEKAFVIQSNYIAPIRDIYTDTLSALMKEHSDLH